METQIVLGKLPADVQFLNHKHMRFAIHQLYSDEQGSHH